ncbi:hypothetical protein BC826DRAFT_1106180 [Russula brevipes]|nr:hypothetical protein BC826DRAFT_1106180 [Russula brevipes]
MPYNLRNVASRMQRRLDAHLAAFGDDRKNIVAVPSATGQGVHLYFDLEPLPAHSNEPGDTNADEETMEDSAGDAPSESNTNAHPRSRHASPHTPRQSRVISAPSTPRAPRRSGQGRPLRRLGSSSSLADSMASIVERGQAQRSQLSNIQNVRPRRVSEALGGLGARDHRQGAQIKATYRRFAEQENVLREQLAELRRENRIVAAQVEQEGWDGSIFLGEESDAESDDSYTPTEVMSDSREGSRTPPAHRVHFSRSSSSVSVSALTRSEAPVFVEDRRMQQQQQQHRVPVRSHAEENVLSLSSPRQQVPSTARRASDGSFIMVTRHVPVLGPMGTMVIDPVTDEAMIETRHYRVRVDNAIPVDDEMAEA